MAKLQMLLPFILTIGVTVAFIFSILNSSENKDVKQLKQLQQLPFTNESLLCKYNVSDETRIELIRIICEKMKTRGMSENNFTFYSEEELQLSKRFLIAENGTCDSETRIVAVVHSRVHKPRRRDVIRETWAKDAARHGIKVLFFVGISRYKDIQLNLVKESLVHKDIIQSPFIENYYNLTLKAFSVLNYLNKWCPNVNFVVKSDEDVFVNIHKVLEFIDKFKSESSPLLIGSPVMKERINDTNNKYFVPPFIYNKNYPDRPAGPLMLFSGKCIQALLSACYKLNPFYIDDAYVYGIVAEYVGIDFYGVPMIRFFRSDEKTNYCDNVGIEGLREMRKMREISLEVYSKHCKSNYTHKYKIRKRKQ